MRYWASLWKYIGSPSPIASYSASQSPASAPVWTQRTPVSPGARASTRYSNEWYPPSSSSELRSANRVGGSHAMTVASIVKPGCTVRAVPPSRGSISFLPMNHESMPGPVVIASQTCSGVAVTEMSWVSSNAFAIAELPLPLRFGRPYTTDTSPTTRRPGTHR